MVGFGLQIRRRPERGTTGLLVRSFPKSSLRPVPFHTTFLLMPPGLTLRIRDFSSQGPYRNSTVTPRKSEETCTAEVGQLVEYMRGDGNSFVPELGTTAPVRLEEALCF